MPGARLERSGGSVTLVRFEIPGEPAPKGSKSVSRSGHMYEQSKHLPGWQRAAVEALAHQACVPPPYRVKVVFVCKRPKNATYNWPVRADLDKYVRAVGDALQAHRGSRAGVILDDKHVLAWDAVKLYGTTPRTYGYVETIKGYV